MENLSLTVKTSLIFWLKLKEHKRSDLSHLKGMLLMFSTRHARIDIRIQEALHSSIYKHVCVSGLLLGPWTAPLVQIFFHVAQGSFIMFHFFLHLQSSQLLLKLWIPCRNMGNNFLQGRRIFSSLIKQKKLFGFNYINALVAIKASFKFMHEPSYWCKNLLTRTCIYFMGKIVLWLKHRRSVFHSQCYLRIPVWL